MKVIAFLFWALFPYLCISQESCFSDDFVLYDQADATNFAENFPTCTIIEGDLVIQGNVNFIGMEQIVEIQGYIRCGGGECNAYPHENFLGLENLTSVGGISLDEHSFSFDGLSSLENITEHLHLSECGLTNNFGDLSNLTTIGGSFMMSETNFESFQGLENLNTVYGNFHVSENDMMLSSDFIGSLSTIGGGFEMDDCSLLENFNDFSALTAVGGNFEISGCPQANSLNGFDNLEYIMGALKLTQCTSLSDISGLANIVPQSITHVEFRNNPVLSYCSVNSICGHLLENGDHDIEMNMDGCNTAEEILNQCVVNISENEPIQFSILSSVIGETIQVSNPNNIRFTIYNSSGQQVFQSNQAGTISISHLASGVYTILSTEYGITHRFVKR